MIGDKIKKRREELGISQEELAKRMGYKSRSSINKIELNLSDVPQKKVVEFANALNTTISYLMNDDEIKNNDKFMYESLNMNYITVPLYSPLCCGNGGFVSDNVIEYVPVPSKGLSNATEYFCQIAHGDSMKDAGIDDGDLLIFEKTPKVSNGQIGCFCIDDNIATCKKFKEQNGLIMLQPMNSNYDPIPVDPMNSSFKCLGKLKKSIKEFNIE